MGFTALDGLVMGTRSGAIDPGVVLHLIEEKGFSAAEVSDLLYNRSGLLGVSGIASDVRVLEADGSAEAEQALDLFAYRAAREIGSLAAALGGLDVLVFSAGIGEHSASMRERICAYSAWLGIAIDAAANAAHGSRISAATSRVDVFVIPTDEEIVIARAAKALLDGGPG
jgi:acetate kinase